MCYESFFLNCNDIGSSGLKSVWNRLFGCVLMVRVYDLGRMMWLVFRWMLKDVILCASQVMEVIGLFSMALDWSILIFFLLW